VARELVVGTLARGAAARPVACAWPAWLVAGWLARHSALPAEAAYSV